MDQPIVKTLIVIAGPTAVGKTAAAIRIAKALHTEIISSDSRQFFREISIGTAKPSPEELMQVTHHFINSHSIKDEMNVGIYEKEALRLIEHLFQKHDVLVMTGGSGLYIDAVCKGFDELPMKDEELREELEKKTLGELQAELEKRDPVYFEKTDKQNPQRLIRAIEVCRLTGRPFSEFRKGESKPRSFRVVKIGLDLDRKVLYNRINKRVDMMIGNGLIHEVKTFRHLRHLNALQTVGYSELFDYFFDKISQEEAIELIKRNTRRFAKRQLTWFRRDPEMKWFGPEDDEQMLAYIHPLIAAKA